MNRKLSVGKAVFLALFFGAFLVLPSTGSADEVTVAKKELRTQVGICDELAQVVEGADLARLQIVRESSATTLGAVEEFGLGNMTTMNFFQLQIITYKYSMRFLDSIRSSANNGMVNQLIGIAQKIESDRGGPFLKITHHVFSNIHRHFRDLAGMGASQSLMAKIEDLNLWAELGDVIASAAIGDRPGEPNCKAVSVFHKIKTLYPDFYEQSISEPIYNTTQSIIGLSEFYVEYANPEQANCPR